MLICTEWRWFYRLESGVAFFGVGGWSRKHYKSIKSNYKSDWLKYFTSGIRMDSESWKLMKLFKFNVDNYIFHFFSVCTTFSNYYRFFTWAGCFNSQKPTANTCEIENELILCKFTTWTWANRVLSQINKKIILLKVNKNGIGNVLSA